MRSDGDISDHSSAPVASATSSKVTAGWVNGATTGGEMPAARSAACRSTSSRMRAEARSGICASSTAVTSRLSRPGTRASMIPAVRSGVHADHARMALTLDDRKARRDAQSVPPRPAPPVSSAPTAVAPASIASPATDAPSRSPMRKRVCRR